MCLPFPKSHALIYIDKIDIEMISFHALAQKRKETKRARHNDIFSRKRSRERTGERRRGG